MIIKTYNVDTRNFCIEETRAELLEHLHAEADQQSHTWGYFPELNPDPEDYRASHRLLGQIGAHCLTTALDIKPVFVRLAVNEPNSEFGGLHIDVSSGVGHRKEFTDGDILRILCNIGTSPRLLQYCPFTIDLLRHSYHLGIPDEEYRIVTLPPEVPVHEITIPPITEHTLSILAFRSNTVLHAGKTTSSGHFLASFGAILPPTHLTTYLSTLENDEIRAVV